MMKASRFIFVPFALGIIGTASIAVAQEPVQLKFSRVVDLTLPIETNMAGIPGFKIYADNPSQVAIIAAMTEGQKEMLRSEGMTLSNNVEINGRAMISVLSIMTHNGTHIDAPRHMMENGFPVDQLPLAQVAKEGVLISLPTEFVRVGKGHPGYRRGAWTGSHSGHPNRLDRQDVGQGRVLGADALS